MGGLTRDETQALARLTGIFREYVQGLCGELAYPEAWRKYGTFDSEKEAFEFFLGWFLDPLRMMVVSGLGGEGGRKGGREGGVCARNAFLFS